MKNYVFSIVNDKNYLFENMCDFIEFTFSPLVKVDFLMDFKIKGKTYNEKKESLRNIAIDYQRNDIGGLSYYEYTLINDFFETNGKRYGLLTEFKENCIC